MRLIDADELLKEIDRHAFNFGLDDLHMLEDVINDMPTVEQKHGHWIAKSIGVSTVYEGHKFFKYVCSVCGREFSGYEFSPENMPYCHCGAKMDEVTEDV